jgi:7,8-dihydropterin-6-yl-methyl-4-(beta-D-ribofuranosyl)aminobenzene 5'-phosphate synthase
MMNHTVDITILVDNKADDGLLAEHGLALWIETGSLRILFDTGQGKALPYNAGILGIDLQDADALVLSHGHYDHTGGVPYVIGRKPNLDIYCHPAVVVPRYSIRSADQPKPIHMSQDSKIALHHLSFDRLHWVSQPMLLTSDIGVTGPIPRKNGCEDTGGPFFLDSHGQHADPINDDQALWIKTSRGLVIIVGCSHAGLVNTIDAIRESTGESSVVAVIGGFHLQNASEERLQKTVMALQGPDFGMLIPCHCTGDAALKRFCASFGDRVRPGHAGMRIRV